MSATKRRQKHKMYFLGLLCFLCLFVADSYADPKAPKPGPKPGPQANTIIIVNERALVGPNSAAQLRGGRLFLRASAKWKAGREFNRGRRTRRA